MALHGLAQFGANTEETMKYKWIGGSIRTKEGMDDRSGLGSFSNMYYKILSGKVYKAQMSKFETGLFVGDINGNPINTYVWQLHCHPRAQPR